MIKVKREAMQAILESSRNTHPKEFIALMEHDKGVITNLVMLPGDVYGETMSAYSVHMLPLGVDVLGSVHSHPTPSNEPSMQDLNAFQSHGGYHAIIAYPYDIKTICFYDKNGEPVEFELV